MTVVSHFAYNDVISKIFPFKMLCQELWTELIYQEDKPESTNSYLLICLSTNQQAHKTTNKHILFIRVHVIYEHINRLNNLYEYDFLCLLLAVAFTKCKEN